MPEYRTKPIDRSLLLAELAAVREALSLANVVDDSISFGWDSNLPINAMWRDQAVPVKDLLSFVTSQRCPVLRKSVKPTSISKHQNSNLHSATRAMRMLKAAPI
jgi:hypothetical protein